MEAVLLLISFGADVNGATDERHDYRAVLHYAVLSGDLAIVTLLIRQGARVAFPPDYRKPTPLDLAILKGDPELVRILVEAGESWTSGSLNSKLKTLKNLHLIIIIMKLQCCQIYVKGINNLKKHKIH